MHMLTYRNRKTAYACGLTICLGILLVLWSQATAAQSLEVRFAPDTQLPNVIRVSTNLVTVPVSVTDTAGQPVSNLNIGDFRLEEDGNAEVISKLADAGQSPLQFALLFDLSGSVNPRFEFALQAANRFLEKTWKPGDRISIVSFSERPGVILDASESMPEALRKLQQLRPTKGATAFFDSVVQSARMLHQSATPEIRKAAIALSDGEDNESNYSLQDAAREVHRSDMIFYSINPSGPSIRLNAISLKGQQNLESLAAETGGTAFVLDKEAGLDAIFDRIASELRAQYLLSYYSSNPRLDGKFRRITVLIPQNPGLRIRARQGYYAIRK
jgi:Ca-activated chloride channel family protein